MLRLLLIALALGVAGAGASAGDRFAVAGLTEAEVRSFFTALQTAVRSRDDERLADLLEYPLRVNRAKGHRLVGTRERFLSAPDAVFTERIRSRVLAQEFSALFVNSRGVMIGNGDVWFSGICDRRSPAGTCRDKKL